MNERDKIYSMLGIAYKGRNLVSGADACKIAVYNESARLIVLSEDTAKNTRKFFDDKCRRRGIPVIVFGNRELLGKSIGKGDRAVLAVLDDGLASAIVKLYGMIER